jgi:hypothetical protein
MKLTILVPLVSRLRMVALYLLTPRYLHDVVLPSFYSYVLHALSVSIAHSNYIWREVHVI